MNAQRGRLFTGLGASLALLVTAIVGILRQTGAMETVSDRYFAATMLPPLVAVFGLWLHRRRPRIGGGLTLIAAGLMLGIAAVGSSDGTGLLWIPAGVLLTLGAHRLWTGKLTDDER